MKKRIFGIFLAFMLTVLQIGGAAAVFAGEDPSITSVAKQSEVTENGRVKVTYEVSGTNLTTVGIKVKEGPNSTIAADQYTVVRSGSGSSQTVSVLLPKNNDPWDVTYNILFYPTETTQGVASAAKESVTVKPDGGGSGPVTPSEAQITSFGIQTPSGDQTELTLPAEGGSQSFHILGSGMTKDNIEVSVTNGAEVEGKFAAPTGTTAYCYINFPKNTESTEKSYVVTANIKGKTDKKTVNVTVKGKEGGTNPGGSGGNASITDAVVNPNNVPAEGGNAALEITGEGLTADNWKVDVKAYIKGTNFEISKLVAAVNNKSENGATIVIPKNTMRNDIEYKVTVTGSDPSKPVIKSILQAKNEEGAGVDVQPTSTMMIGNNKLVVLFNEEIKAAKEGDALKDLIFIANSTDEAKDQIKLKPADKVTVEGKKITIDFAEPIKNMPTTESLYIKKGALRNAADELLNNIAAYIKTGINVEKITVDPEVMTYKAGNVTALIKGSNLDQVDVDDVKASIKRTIDDKFIDDIDFKITAGKDIKIEYTLPENTTDDTISYQLVVSIAGGNAVYNIDDNNRAYAPVTSVLPKGKGVSERTLSGISLNVMGVTKDHGMANNYAEAFVSKHIGSLKTIIKLTGTNLSSDPETGTDIRMIDENGVVWPFYHIAECDGTFRFVGVNYEHKTGITGDGNNQLIELLPPRKAGTDKVYTIQVSLDGGQTWLDAPKATLKVNNAGISGEPGWFEAGKDNLVETKVKYVDENGKEIADADTYKGYKESMMIGFGISPKKIDGYELKEEPEWYTRFKNETFDNGHTLQAAYIGEYKFVYKNTAPVKPGSKDNVMLKGMHSLWNPAVGGDMYFKSSGDFTGFISVKVTGADGYDRILISGDDYIASEGSIKVTLKESYIKTLKPGKYQLHINASSGVATTDFTIAQLGTSNNNSSSVAAASTIGVKTGDNTYILGFGIAAIIAFAVLTEIAYLRKKQADNR